MPLASLLPRLVDHDQPRRVAEQARLRLRGHITPLDDDHAQRRDVPPVRLGVERARIGLANASPTIDMLLIRSRLRPCRAARPGSKRRPDHRDDGAAEHQVRERVEQRRCRASAAPPAGCAARAWTRAARIESRRRGRRLAVGRRRGRRGGRPGATSRPSASRSCRRCRGVQVVAASGPTDRDVPRSPASPRPSRTASPTSGHGPLPSSTHSHVADPRDSRRISCAALGERAVEHDGDASALSHRYAQLVVRVAVVGVDRRRARP